MESVVISHLQSISDDVTTEQTAAAVAAAHTSPSTQDTACMCTQEVTPKQDVTPKHNVSQTPTLNTSSMSTSPPQYLSFTQSAPGTSFSQDAACTSVTLECTSIHIGSLKGEPEFRLTLSTSGVDLSLTGTAGDWLDFHVGCEELVKIKSHLSDAPRVMFIYTSPECGERIRQLCNMMDNSGTNYDPLSKVDSERRIAVMLEPLPDQVIRSIGMICWKMEDHPEAQCMLHKKIGTQQASTMLGISTPQCSKPVPSRVDAPTSTPQANTDPSQAQAPGEVLMATEDEFAGIIERTNADQKTKYTSLKEKQKEALRACKDKDLVCMLPTGYGKTIIIQMLPYLHEETTSVIIIAPLNAIIEEQKERFGASCIVADNTLLVNIEEGEESTELKRLRAGDFRFLLGHPEAMIDPALRKILMTDTISSKISHIVIDEAHCVLSWGKSKFREDFAKIYCLRATLLEAKIIALTATATEEAVSEIAEALHMKKPLTLKESPDRPSVYIEVKRRPPNCGTAAVDFCIDPLLEELKEEGENFPRTIVYLPLKWCGYVHERALRFLGLPKLPTQESDDMTDLRSLVAQYHAPQTPQMKKLITATMKNPDSMLRLLIATEAYGMGTDCPNVRRIIHIGPPKSLETYTQEVGRCARDGGSGQATLFFNMSDIAEPNNEKKGKTLMTDSMRVFCCYQECRRALLMRYFGFTLKRDEHHKCCDNCCGTTEKEPSSSDPPPNRVVADTLQQYFDAENETYRNTNTIPEIHTGLCSMLAKKIASYPDKYMDQEHLGEDFEFLTSYQKNMIAELIALALSDDWQ